jgi:hypothetical protein
MTLADTIELISKYKVGDTATDDISNAQLALLEASTAARVTRLNPGFTSAELQLFTGYICLDAWESRNPEIVEKTVKDVRWKVKSSSSTSSWLDKAMQMRNEYITMNGINIAPSGVSRCDYDMKGFDSTDVKQWGDPSASI